MYKQVTYYSITVTIVANDLPLKKTLIKFPKIYIFIHLGEHIANVSCTSSTFTIAWHPKRYLLAYACDEKDKYDRDRSVGLLKVYGFPNEDSTSRSSGTTVEK